MSTLLLVDGSSYLYRAFHALPDLRNKAGEPTGAIYGMVNMLRKLRQDIPAQYSACIFDAKGKTFRDDWYPQYKATRTAMPDDLIRQIGPIHTIVTALGWPVIVVDGIEADDVIGTLAKRATEAGMRTIISTGDKDLVQLVDANVMWINTMSNERLDAAGVKEKFGVPPDRIVDYLSLVGDSVDNIPGVEKVGPKTAVKWLEQYGSLEGVIAHAGEVKGAVGDNLRRALDWLPQARRLVTVKTDCDLLPHIESIAATLTDRPEDRETLKTLSARYEFRAWMKELDGTPAPLGGAQVGRSASTPDAMDASSARADGPADLEPAPIATDYRSILTEAQLDEWLAKIEAAEITALDIETTSLDPMQAQLVGVAFSVEPGEAAYLPLAHRTMTEGEVHLDLDFALKKLRLWLEDPAKKKLGHHMKYGAHVFENHGIRLAGVAHDTLLESYVLESHRNHELDDLARRHLNIEGLLNYEDLCGKGVNQISFDHVPIEQATHYAAQQTDIALRVHRKLFAQIAADEKLSDIYHRIELPSSTVLQKMERGGVLIDADLLSAHGSQLGTRMAELEARAYDAAGQPFNLGSPKQLGEILFTKLKLPVARKTASGAPSTDEEVLVKLAEDYPLPKIVLDHRGLSKLKSTYTDKLPRSVNRGTGRVHTTYGQAIAVTGRLSSNDPNLQNIPIRTAEGRRIREAFIAAPGSIIVSADYSQIELRIMAHISGDEGLRGAFARGDDVHRATASEVFGVDPANVSSDQRRVSKIINFGLMYGMSPFGLAANLGIDRDAAKTYMDRYFMRYPGVANYMQETRVLAKQRGYVETVFGRRLWLAEINSPNGPRRQAAERAAINAPMQGTAADLIKLSMIAVHDWLEHETLASRMIMQVHDELVLEVPEAEIALISEHLPRLMADVAELAVPLEVELGQGSNWDEAH